MEAALTDNGTFRVFCSYSHRDDRHRQRLLSSLAPLRREGLISQWDDTEIDAGDDWSDEIQHQLETADVILLLVTADFLASDFCYGNELKRAMERHEDGTALVIPVVVRPTDWQSAPFSKLHVLPKHGKPIVEHQPVDRGYLDVVKGIRRALLKRVEQEPPVVTGNGHVRPPMKKRVSEPGAMSASRLTHRHPDAPPGFFRTPGSFHVHIDGDLAQMESLVPALGDSEPSFPGKFNSITQFSQGPQRKLKDFAETYRHHTPGADRREEFAAFSTTWLGTGADLRPEAVDALEQVIAAVTRTPGPVVELERVVGVLHGNGDWDPAEPELIPAPSGLDRLTDSYQRRSTFPIEIHHAIDIPRTAQDVRPPLSIKEMPVGLDVGGWFLFEKEDTWAYRSSQFADWSDYYYVAREGMTRVQRFLSEQRTSGTVHTLVEQVLGIWRFDQQPKQSAFQSVPDLAHWERRCPPNTNFWVIAANFLGDKSPDVRDAMIKNLQEKVTYTYFLGTYADVLRLGMLREELERELREVPGMDDSASEIVNNQLNCVLLPARTKIDDRVVADLLRSDYFLCPDDPAIGGYRLRPRATGGTRLENAEIREIVTALSPVLEQKIASLYLSPDDRWTPSQDDYPRDYCIACTDLRSLAGTFGDRQWRTSVAEYDRIVAREVSTFVNGTEPGPISNAVVVRPVRNGYLLVFRHAEVAVEWAKRLQLAVKARNDRVRREGAADPLLSHSISLDRGPATRVLRAHGYDYIGAAVDDCIGLVANCSGVDGEHGDGAIVMSSRFADEYKARVGAKEFGIRTTMKAGATLALWPNDPKPELAARS